MLSRLLTRSTSSSMWSTPSAIATRLWVPKMLIRQGSVVPTHIREEQGRASVLHHSVGYLGDFQLRIDSGIDSL